MTPSLSLDNLTQHVVEATTQNIPGLDTSSQRTKLVLTKLIQHLHAFVQETQLTTQEWELGIDFLTRTGQKCDDKRQEFILLSDVLGVSAVVNSVNNPAPSEQGQGNKKLTATESSLLGPFWVDHAPDIADAGSIVQNGGGGGGAGEPLLVRGHVYDTEGNPVEAILDVWETDETGHYDVQLPLSSPNHRGRIRSSPRDGSFLFTAILPVTYPVPTDGPVGELLRKCGRHPMRPSHLHFVVEPVGEVKGVRKLVTAIYDAADPHIHSDAVFGVKSSLIATYARVSSEDPDAKKVGFKGGEWLLEWDFVLGRE